MLKVKQHKIWLVSFSILLVIIGLNYSPNVKASSNPDTEDLPDSAFKVVDQFKDKADLPDGRAVYRIYAQARAVERQSDGSLKLRGKDWSLFDGDSDSQLKLINRPGYDYSFKLFNKNNKLSIVSGNLEFGKNVIQPQIVNFKQQQGNSQMVSTLENVYPGIDFEFTDYVQTRQKNIIIRELPKNFTINDNLIIWEKINLGNKYQAYLADGTRITGDMDITQKGLYLKDNEGNRLDVSTAVASDSSGRPTEFIENPNIYIPKQSVRFDKNNKILQVSVQLEGKYLLNKERVLPVIVDPTYTGCSEVAANNMTCTLRNFYLRAKNGGSDSFNICNPAGNCDASAANNQRLFIGNYSSGGYYTRHALLYFDLPNLSTIGSISSAMLHMYYNIQGSGTAASASLKAKKLSNAPNPTTIPSGQSNTYSYASARTNLSALDSAATVTATPDSKWYAWDISNTVKSWYNSPSGYFALLVEGADSWSSGATPPASWSNRLFVFMSKEYTTDSSPYIQITTASQPDLMSSSYSLNKTQFNSGEQLQLSLTVKNNGTGTANPNYVRYYLNKDNVGYTAASSISQNLVQTLNAGATQSAPLNYNLNGLTPGTYYLSWELDWQGAISESDENNNRNYLQFTIAQPDLVGIDNTIAPVAGSQIKSGDFISIVYKVKNSGNIATTASTVKVYYYFKQGSADYSTNYKIGEDDFGILAVGGTSSETIGYQVPAGLSAGTYTFYYWIDPTYLVSESNENNNRYEFTYTVAASDPLEPNDTSAQAYNIGTGTSYGNSNLTLVANDQDWFKFIYNTKTYYFKVRGYDLSYTGNYGISFSRSGSVVTIETLLVDSNLDTYLELYDSNGTTLLTEDDDAGNGSFSKITSYNLNPLPDLIPSNGTITSAGTLYGGNTINYSYNIQNSGTVAVNNLVYNAGIADVSNGTTFGLLSESPSSMNLAAGYSGTKSMSATIDDNCSMPYESTYKITLILDPDKAIAESNDNNNVADTTNNIKIRRYSTCGGGGGGGSTPPDYDKDSFFDPEEYYAGTNILAVDAKPIKDVNYAAYLSKQTDLIASNQGGDPVNTRTGAFEFTQTDFALPGRGEAINFTRTYNSRLFDRNNRMGNGWSHSYNWYYYQDATSKNVELYLGGSLAAMYTTTDGGTTFTPPVGEFDKLYKDTTSGKLVYQKLNGVKYIFSGTTNAVSTNVGVLESIVDTNGNITTLTYASVRSMPLLTTITDASGRSISLTYGASTDDNKWDKIVRIQDNVNPSSPVVITYEYDANKNLTHVQSNRVYNGSSETLDKYFTYSTDGKMLTYTDARGTILYNTYDSSGRVTEQYEFNPNKDTTGTKRKVYTFEYQGADAGVVGSTHCTLLKNYRDTTNFYSDRSCFNANELKIYQANGLNQAQTWTYDATGMPASFTDANGVVTNYTYDSRRRLTKEVLPDANGYHTEKNYTYENNFNRLTSAVVSSTKSGATLIQTTSYNINTTNGNVMDITDPMGYKQYFTYDSAGNVLTAVDKNGVTTTYTYDANKNYRTSDSVVVKNVDNVSETITNSYLYDNYGNRLRHIDPKGNIYNYEFDTKGNLRKLINPDSTYKTFTYDVEDHKLTEVDELGRTTTYVYDKDINASLLSITKDNTVQNYQYDWLGNKLKEIDPLNRETIYTYDAANRLVTKQTPVNTITYTYDGVGNLLSQTNSLAEKTAFVYDARNQKVETKNYLDASNYVSTVNQYDGLGRVISNNDPRGNTTNYTYNLNNQVLIVTDPLNNVETYTYDKNGNKKTIVDKNNHTTSYTYDALNRLIKETNPANKETLKYYDKNGNLLKMVDRQNVGGINSSHVSEYTYDSLNRRLTEKDAYNNNTVFTYDNVGNVLTKTDKVGGVWTNTYDNFNRLSTEKDPANNLTSYTYDKIGNKITITYPNNKMGYYTYDVGNRLIEISDAWGNVIVYDYDAVGNKTLEQDKRGFFTTFIYDKLNRLVTETNPQNTATTYTYDNNGNKLSMSVAGKTTSFEYDKLNRQTKTTYPGNKIESVTYDAVGNKLTLTNGNNETVVYIYDSLNRPLTKQVPGQGTTNYTYDQWNNVLSVNDVNGTVNYTYDNKNRNLTEVRSFADLVGKTYTISRDYYADDQLKTLTDASGAVITYNYDNRGLLSGVVQGAKTLATYTYNAISKPQSLTSGNGVVANYTYDDLQRLATQEIIFGTSTLYKQEYTYDTESNRTSVTENSSRTLSYTYDNLGQLTNVDYSNLAGTNDLSYTYDAWGNRTNSHTVNGDTVYNYANNTNELLNYVKNGVLNTELTYDNNGSLKTETMSRLGNTQLTNTYAWDALGQLTGINYHYASGRPDNNLSFAYDELGNRIKKTINGNQVETTYYLNNGLRVLNEVDGLGVSQKTLIYGLDQIAELDKTGKLTYVHTDVLGSTVLLTDEQGAKVAEYEYDPFGAVMGYEGSQDTNYLFTNQEFDPESELYYYNARYYNPVTGRFISRDPVLGREGDVLSRNGYVYANNNPLKYTDPDGNVNWDLMWEGAKQTFWGGLDLVVGGAEMAGGATLVGAAVAGEVVTVGGATVPAVLVGAGGVGLAGMGANNAVAGGTKAWGGLTNMWNSVFNDEAETVDYTYNPVHEAIDANTEKGSNLNTALHLGYTGLDLVGGTLGLLKAGEVANSMNKIGQTGEYGEQFLKGLGGESQVSFKTSNGYRYVDQMVNNVAQESKVGYTTLNSKTALQVAKDQELLKTGQISSYNWNFFKSPVTGMIGPSAPLANALKQGGIGINIYDNLNFLKYGDLLYGGSIINALSKVNSLYNYLGGDNK